MDPAEGGEELEVMEDSDDQPSIRDGTGAYQALTLNVRIHRNSASLVFNAELKNTDTEYRFSRLSLIFTSVTSGE